jgi:hypothetical protein
MNTYVYYYKSDLLAEPLGKFQSPSYDEAVNYVIQVKRLPLIEVTKLFFIKKLDAHENNI